MQSNALPRVLTTHGLSGLTGGHSPTLGGIGRDLQYPHLAEMVGKATTMTLPNRFIWEGHCLTIGQPLLTFLLFAALPTDHCTVTLLLSGMCPVHNFLILCCASIRLPEQRETNSLTYYGVELESAD